MKRLMLLTFQVHTDTDGIFIPNESKEREVLDQIWNCPSDLFSLFYKFIMQIVLIDSFHSFENG